MKETSVAVLVVMFGIMSFASVLFMEVVPLLLVTDYTHGGFMLDSAEISIVLTVSGTVQLLYQAFIYPLIAARMGVRRLFQTSLFLSAILLMLVPLMTSITGDITADLIVSGSNVTTNISVVTHKPSHTVVTVNNTMITEMISSIPDSHSPSKPLHYKIWSGPSNLEERMLVLHPSFSSISNTHTRLLTPTLSYATHYAAAHTSSIIQQLGNVTLPSIFSSPHPTKVPSMQIRPTNVQRPPCRSCSMSESVSTSPRDTPSPSPEIPVGQCKFDVEPGVQTSHMTLSQVPVKVWAVTGVVIAANFMILMSAFTCINILIGNSCKRSVRGTVYGLCQSLGSLGRFISPMVGGSLFAWSQRNGLGWPLNYHFLFYCLTAVLFVLFILSTRLPRTIDKQKEEVTV